MQIEWEGKFYDYDAERDLTVSRLRHIKSWYPEMGGYLRFVSACAYGEPDAYACLLWILRKTAGESTQEPMQMDFSVLAFRNALDAAAEVEAKRLGVAAEVDPTVGPTGPSPDQTTPEQESSEPTPTSSEGNTSDS